jgi:hypothetical protein
MRDNEKRYIEDVTPIAATDKALLVLVGLDQVWIPKSLIDDESEVYSMKSGAGVLVIPGWLADREGI